MGLLKTLTAAGRRATLDPALKAVAGRLPIDDLRYSRLPIYDRARKIPTEARFNRQSAKSAISKRKAAAAAGNLDCRVVHCRIVRSWKVRNSRCEQSRNVPWNLIYTRICFFAPVGSGLWSDRVPDRASWARSAASGRKIPIADLLFHFELFGAGRVPGRPYREWYNRS